MSSNASRKCKFTSEVQRNVIEKEDGMGISGFKFLAGKLKPKELLYNKDLSRFLELQNHAKSNKLLLFESVDSNFIQFYYLVFPTFQVIMIMHESNFMQNFSFFWKMII